MKLLVATALLFIITSVHSQKTFPTEDGKVVFQFIDSSVQKSADELYRTSKLWTGNTFRDSKEVIQVDDPSGHSLMGKGNFQFAQTMTPYVVSFSFKIDTKDNKYRIRFYDIYTEMGTMRIKKTAERWNDDNGSAKIKSKINEGFESMIESFKKSMAGTGNSDF